MIRHKAQVIAVTRVIKCLFGPFTLLNVEQYLGTRRDFQPISTIEKVLPYPHDSMCSDVPCTAYRVSCTTYWVLCTMYRVSCTVYRVPCIMYHVPCTLFYVPCTLYHVLCTWYFVLCTVSFYRNTTKIIFKMNPSAGQLAQTG